MSLFDLSGRVAVVTGGTTGLGHGIALGLADAGADVVATSRRLEQVGVVASEIEARGRRSMRITSDVTDRASMRKLHDAVLKEFGKVDILVNAAGITHKSPTLEESEAEWSRVIETNLTGTLRACQIFGKTMVKAGYGRIINIASLTTFVGFLSGGGVCASKAAVGSLTQGAGRRAGEDGRECERHCAGHVSDGAECEADYRHAARRRAAHASAHGTLRQGRRNWPARRCFWHRMHRPTSPARLLPSMEASWPAE